MARNSHTNTCVQAFGGQGKRSNYKVLSITKYYSGLQSILPYYKILLRTTKQCCVLQSILQIITRYYKVPQSSSPRHMKRPVHCAEQPMRCKTQWELRHSWSIVVTHETSNKLARATYGMQNTVECFWVATHETSNTLHYLEQPMGCKTRWSYDIHVW